MLVHEGWLDYIIKGPSAKWASGYFGYDSDEDTFYQFSDSNKSRKLNAFKISG
jgi:hypothetical protein